MRTTILTAALIGAALVTGAVAGSRTYGEGDFAAIVDASRHNELRFNRDYADQTFATTRPFKRATEAGFGLIGEYRISFGTGGAFSGDVDCLVPTSDPVLNQIVDWRKGTIANVTGTIRTTTMGDLQLKNCQITAR